MREYIVDLSEVQTREQLHQVMAEALEFPDYYGGNLDAMYDCMSELAGVIKFGGCARAEAMLGDYFRYFRGVCNDVVIDNPALQIFFM